MLVRSYYGCKGMAWCSEAVPLGLAVAGLGSRGAHVCAVTDQPAARLDAVRVWRSSHCPSARASVADVCVQVTPPSFLPVGQP